MGFLALTKNLVAGATTAVMLVPQAMAYALLAGLDPIVGLYASTWPLVAYAVAGRCPQLAVGPAALDAILVGTALGVVGVAGSAGAAAVLAAMTGALLVLGSSLRMGRFAGILTPSILGGFTTAAAVLIAVSQLPLLLGVKVERAGSLWGSVRSLVAVVGDTQPLVVVLGAVAVGALVGMKRASPRVPRFLVVVLAAIVLSWVLSLDVPVVGAVPGGLSAPRLPGVSWDTVIALIPWAFVLTAISTIETVSIAAHFTAEEDRSPDYDLRGMGLANLIAGVTGGMNVSAGFSRSAVHADAGATRRAALAMTAAVVAVVLVGLTAPLAFLPRAVLAAIIVASLPSFVRLNLARKLWNHDRIGFLGFVATCGASLLIGVVPGLTLGVVVEHATRWVTGQQSASAIQ